MKARFMRECRKSTCVRVIFVYSKIIFGRNIQQIEQSTAKPYKESGFLWCEKVRVVRYKLAIARRKVRIARKKVAIVSLFLRIASLYLAIGRKKVRILK